MDNTGYLLIAFLSGAFILEVVTGKAFNPLRACAR